MKDELHLLLISLDLCIEECLRIESLYLSDTDKKNMVYSLRDCADICALNIALIKRNSNNVINLANCALMACTKVITEMKSYGLRQEGNYCIELCGAVIEEARRVMVLESA